MTDEAALTHTMRIRVRYSETDQMGTFYNSRALESIPFASLTSGFHFDGEMVLSAARAGLRIQRVPISTSYGGDTSSLSPLPYLHEVAGTVVRYGCRRFWFQRSS